MKLIQDPERKAKTASQSATGSSILYLPMTIPNSYNSFLNSDIICLSKTYLDSYTPLDDSNLEISKYTLVPSDDPVNTKNGVVCIY